VLFRRSIELPASGNPGVTPVVVMAPEEMLSLLSQGRTNAQAFREALTGVPQRERDVWLNRVLGLPDSPPPDGPELPRGCVPYVPCSVETLLSMIDLGAVGPDDVFVDVGSGEGRAIALTHLLTGARVVGIEIQPELVCRSRALAARLGTERLSVFEGDAATLTDPISSGSVFFLYCPFGGARLERLIDQIGSIATTRSIRVCTVDLPPLERPWLTPVSHAGELSVYRRVR